jgi:hypothetical protein
MVDWHRVPFALLAGRRGGELFQLIDQRFELLIASPALAKRGVLRRPARLQNRA